MVFENTCNSRRCCVGACAQRLGPANQETEGEGIGIVQAWAGSRLGLTPSTVLAQDHFYSDLCCFPSTCQTQASSMEMSVWQRHVEGSCFKQVDDNWRCQFLNGCLCLMCLFQRVAEWLYLSHSLPSMSLSW